MNRAALEVTDADRAAYRATALRRRAEELAATEAHRERAWLAARSAAAHLRANYGATRVAVYGSLARGSGFSRWSDVDLFAAGIPDSRQIAAIADVFYNEQPIQVNVAPLEILKPHVREQALIDAVDL